MMKRICRIMSLILLFDILIIPLQAQKNKILTEKSILCSMAGYGDPWSSITDKRNQIILALHNGYELNEIAMASNMTEQQIKDEINPLVESNLIINKGNRYIPDVFVANEDEAEIFYLFSKSIGEVLADTIIKKWDDIEKAFSELSISQTYRFKELGFMLVGSRILDIGVLGALTKDKNLLLPAPARPSPSQPDGRYYFWILEGDQKLQGKYGQEDADLKFKYWSFLNFGQSSWDRNSYLEEVDVIYEKDTSNTPNELANILKTPFLNKVDSKNWESFSNLISYQLLDVLRENDSRIKTIYGSIRSTEYSNRTYNDFYCWLYHITFAWAIDKLVSQGFIDIPKERHSSIIMYKEELDGVLSK